MALTLLSRPRPRRMLLGLIAYPLTALAPLLVSWGLLEAIGHYRGERLPVGWILLTLFGIRHLNVFIVSTLYHKSMSHQALRFHPLLERALRVWGWLFVGTGARVFATLHRWHHATSDTAEDPHSPTKHGESLWTVARQTHRSYLQVLNNLSDYQRFSHGLPDDRLEAFVEWDARRNFGFRGARLPLLVALGLGVLVPLFGWQIGGLVLLASFPATVGGVFATSVFTVNGLCHVLGYQNFESDQTATNLFPLELIAWGEALHQNHHMSPSSANFAYRPWEWDPGYTVLWLFSKVGLVRDLQTPRPVLEAPA